MKETADIMFSLIRYELTGESPALCDPDKLEAIYVLSKKHDLAHIAGNALKKSSANMTADLSQKFDKKIMTALFRYEQSRYELEQIKSVFEKENVPFIPLKGSVIRELYPEPWMRTSCDIDVLVKEDDLPKAVAALSSALGYTVTGRGSHDVQLLSSSKVNIELHYTLIEENFVSKSVEKALNDAWNYAFSENGGALYTFTDEFFLFYHIAHMAKHFTVGGGCGVRPFLDLHILERSRPTSTELISKNGLLPFFEASKKLSDVWFSHEAHDKTTEKMEKYILDGGTFGNLQNRVAVGKAKSGNGASYVFSRLFPPYNVMKNKHPSIRKCPLLLPFFYVKRWLTPLFDGRFKKTAKELSLSAGSSADNEYTEMMEKLGI